MILKKDFAGKERIVAEFGTGDILFTGSNSLEGKVLLTFNNANKEHSLDEVISAKNKTWEGIDPYIVFSFTSPKSIQNMIDTLEECKNALEVDLAG